MFINFDMDGVLAKFLFGTPFPELYKEHYWTNLPPQMNPLETAKKLSAKYPVRILSSYLEDSPYALKEKKVWLKSWLPEIPERNWVFVPYGQSKGMYLTSPKDILIDDRGVHGQEWTDAGGKFIKMSVDKKDAIKEMKKYKYVLCPELPVETMVRIVESFLYS